MIEGWFDGACEPINPGGTASYGAFLIKDGTNIWSESKLVEKGLCSETTNNVAEYAGLIAILEYLIDKELTAEAIIVYGDSMMVIKQMFGTWKIKSGIYMPIALRCKWLVTHFNNLKGQWIPREENGAADALSIAALTKVGVFRSK